MIFQLPVGQDAGKGRIDQWKRCVSPPGVAGGRVIIPPVIQLSQLNVQWDKDGIPLGCVCKSRWDRGSKKRRRWLWRVLFT